MYRTASGGESHCVSSVDSKRIPAETPAWQARNRSGGQRRRVAAEAVFFPIAVVYAAVAVPMSVYGMRSGEALLPGFATVTGHAHELLFGFALAVAAGFLVTRASRPQLAALIGLWLLARLGFLAFPESLFALGANIALAGYLGRLVIPQFLKGAKKLRNRTIGPLLGVLCLAVAVFHFAGMTMRTWLQFLILQETVLLFAMLMLFMGGRIIAPAAAGAIQRAGGHLGARVQPRVEGAVLVMMICALVLAVMPGGRPVAGVFTMGAGLLAFVRLARWRLPACRGRPDLWCLGVGYGWLGVGLGLFGLAWTGQWLPAVMGVHAITVGALGTLTTAVMARVRLTRNKLDPARERVLPWVALSIAAATVTRLVEGGSDIGLGISAALWSMAFVLLLSLLVRVPAR